MKTGLLELVRRALGGSGGVDIRVSFRFMRAKQLFLTSAAFFAVGFVTIWTRWQGTAGLNAGSSASAWGINFCGSVNGWAAAIGIICLLAAVILLIGALIRGATSSAGS